MANKSDELESPPPVINFTLNIKNTVEEQLVLTVTVSAKSGQTLLQALKEYQKINHNFRFQTEDVPTSGPYVVAVWWDGKNVGNGEYTFWETLLYNDGNKEVKPISLCYRVCSGDNAHLMFSLL